MKEGINIDSNILKISSLVMGILFIIVGVLDIICGVGIDSSVFDTMFIASDIIGGGILIVVGAIFVYGYKEMKEGKQEGFGFILVGTLLVVALFIVYMLVMVADIAEFYIIESEDYEDWTIKDSIRIEMFLFLIELILMIPYILKNKKYIQR